MCVPSVCNWWQQTRILNKAITEKDASYVEYRFIFLYASGPCKELLINKLKNFTKASLPLLTSCWLIAVAFNVILTWLWD